MMTDTEIIDYIEIRGMDCLNQLYLRAQEYCSMAQAPAPSIRRAFAMAKIMGWLRPA